MVFAARVLYPKATFPVPVVFVLNDPDISNETLSNTVEEIKKLDYKLSKRTPNQIRALLSTILPEYIPELDANEPVYLRLKAEA